ncbi:hypothetical protein AVEN_129793-1 [Araneus ventricosus]|uniref:Uncharacterized protein n=1 Tax=Araneus ventricosus TaxID=182803 RepID=A0A4Y2FMB4_ARAVE|nr:hypothetical protein AVEN_129793-1 [Araneus ventricosus]
MLQLENVIDPSVFRMLIQGFLTVRRSARTSTDMIIEQSQMKSMQTDGGISRGRSTEESAISKRVYSMHAMNTVCERLEDLVFDGYSDYTKNIKVVEQRRRTTKISSPSDVPFDRFMTLPTNRQQFLANTHNKSRFISVLSEKLKAADIFVKQANNDADVLII